MIFCKISGLTVQSVELQCNANSAFINPPVAFANTFFTFQTQEGNFTSFVEVTGGLGPSDVDGEFIQLSFAFRTLGLFGAALGVEPLHVRDNK